MVGLFAEKNLLSDDAIRSEYYEKYLAKIKANSEFQKMENIVGECGLQIAFYFYKDVGGLTIQYNVGFEVCDESGETLTVPTDSRFFDILNCLASDFPVVVYKKLRKKLVLFEIDEKELSEDCKLFSEFLHERHGNNL